MGDAPDAGVLILFVPLLLAPVFAIAKWIVAQVVFSRANAVSWRQVVIVAIAESFLPLATIMAYFPFLIIVRFAAPILLEERWFRLSGFLLMLYVANCATNYLLFERAVLRRRVPEQGVAIVRSLMQGMTPTIMFVLAWEAVGTLLEVQA